MTIRVYQDDGVTVVEGAGEVDLAKIRDMFIGIRESLPEGAVARILIFDQGTTFVPFTEDIRKLLEALQSIFTDRQIRIGVIAGREAQYGAARMFQTRSEIAGVTARAFRPAEEDEAWEWIRRDLADK